MACQDVVDLLLELETAAHPVDKVRAAAITDQNARPVQVELPGYIAAHVLGRRGGPGADRDPGERVAQDAQLSAFGPEIMPPQADTVRLVDRDGANPCALEKIEALWSACAGGNLQVPDCSPSRTPSAGASRLSSWTGASENRECEVQEKARLQSRNYPWAQLMTRTFSIDVLACPRCGARMRILCAINPPDEIRKILASLGLPARNPPISPAM